MNAYYLAELNELARVIYERNVRLGFYEEDKVRPLDGMLANVHGEVSEALEEWRKGKDFDETYWRVNAEVGDMFRWTKDEGLQVKNYEWDYKGGDSSVPEWLPMTPERLRNMPNMIRHLKPEGIPSELADIIIRVLDICAYHKIDIAHAISDKMAYNETRPYRHGDKRS